MVLKMIVHGNDAPACSKNICLVDHGKPFTRQGSYKEAESARREKDKTGVAV